MLKYRQFGIISANLFGNITENIYLCSVILDSSSGINAKTLDINAKSLDIKRENATGGTRKNDEIINWVLSRIGYNEYGSYGMYISRYT